MSICVWASVRRVKSVCSSLKESTPMMPITSSGITVQTTSTIAWPCHWGGRNPGGRTLRRKRSTTISRAASTPTKTTIAGSEIQL